MGSRSEPGASAERNLFGRCLALRAFFGTLARYRKTVGVMVGGRVLTSVLAMGTPLLTKYLIDNVVARKDWNAYRNVAVVIVALLVVSFGLSVLLSYLGMRIEQQVSFDIRRLFQQKRQRLPIAYFHRWGIGEHTYRATADVQNVTTAMLKIAPDTFLVMLNFVTFAVIAAALNLRLTLLYLVALPVIAVVEISRSRCIRPLQEKAQRVATRMNESAAEYAMGVASAKVYRREKLLGNRFLSAVLDLFRIAVRKWQIDTLFQSAEWVCNVVWGWVVIFYGFSLVMRGDLTLGALVALKLYLTGLTQPIQEVGGLIQSLVAGSVSAERLNETLLAGEERDTGDLLLPVWGKRPIQVSFEGLVFAYEPGRLVFGGLTATLPRGGIVGLAGCSGAGKTTIASLLVRLYDPQSGAIRLNGYDLREIPLGHLRSMVTIAPRDPFLFQGTVRENIAFGDSGASLSEITRAAELAGAHEFIGALEHGYETLLSPQGASLSAGQKQRIGLARALLRPGGLLVLDEAIGSVDHAQRMIVIESLRQIGRATTILLVSHDRDLLAHCDHVFHLDSEGLRELELVGWYSPDAVGLLRFAEDKSQCPADATTSRAGAAV